MYAHLFPRSHVSRFCGHFAVIPVKTGIHLHAIPDRVTTRSGERLHTKVLSLSITVLTTLRSKMRDNPLQTLEIPRTLFDACARNDIKCQQSLATTPFTPERLQGYIQLGSRMRAQRRLLDFRHLAFDLDLELF